MKSQEIFKAYNEITRKFETIDINEAELLPGQKVVKMFWCNSDDRFVTVPGASIYQVNSDLNLELTGE